MTFAPPPGTQASVPPSIAPPPGGGCRSTPETIPAFRPACWPQPINRHAAATHHRPMCPPCALARRKGGCSSRLRAASVRVHGRHAGFRARRKGSCARLAIVQPARALSGLVPLGRNCPQGCEAALRRTVAPSLTSPEEALLHALA